MLEKGKKRTRKKAPPVAAAPPAPARSVSRPGPISAEERRHMVAEAAYFRAQRRGFRGGDPDRDWIEAEAEIDALLLNRR